MHVDQGNAYLSATGFCNPMIGVGDAVGVSGGAGGGGGLAGVFDIEDGKIVRCALVFGRQWVKCGDTALGVLADGSTPSGVIYAVIDHSSTDVKLDVKHDASGNLPENSLHRSYRALYYAASSGDSTTASWADVRFQPTMFAMN